VARSPLIVSVQITDLHEGTMKSKSKLPPLKTTKLGASTMVYYDSALRAVGIDPATEPSDRPKTISIKQTEKLIGKSRATVNRMIVAGREAAAA
jgi:hypothetical protein